MLETELCDSDCDLDWRSSTSSKLQPQEERLVQQLNQLVKERLGESEFSWGGFRVTSADREQSYVGSVNGGISLSFFVARRSAGDNSACGDLPAKCKMQVVDVRCPFTPVNAPGVV